MVKIQLIQFASRLIFAAGCMALVFSVSAGAIEAMPIPSPIPGAYGVEATKTQAPPTRGATISTPGNGTNTTNPTVTVTGICPKGLLVEIFDNGVMAGATMCSSGSFSVKISLFAGKNDISAMVYDELGQTGPKSNVVTVNYSDLHLVAFGQAVTLTSSYGRRAAAAGSELTWPLQLSGGTGPYALSVDWGDGTPSQLKSLAVAGGFNINHVYQNAGIYQINVTATDHNGVSSFIQLVAVASGKVTADTAVQKTPERTVYVTKIVWIPAVIALLLLVPAYLLGRRSQLVSIRHKMLRERDSYENDQKS
jgi:hypothetical protein